MFGSCVDYRTPPSPSVTVVVGPGSSSDGQSVAALALVNISREYSRERQRTARAMVDHKCMGDDHPSGSDDTAPGESDKERINSPDLELLAKQIARINSLHMGTAADIAAFNHLTKNTQAMFKGAAEMAGLASRINIGNYPGLTANLAPWKNIIGNYPGLTATGSIATAIQEMLRRLDPPNWPDGIDLDIAETILNEDGIPLVWVPPAEVVELLIKAPDRISRVDILITYRSEVVDSCHEALQEVKDPSFNSVIPLVDRCMDAADAGHDEAGQALAVVIAETVIRRHIKGAYKKIAADVIVDFDDVPIGMLRLRAALAPIGRFFTPWWPSDPGPPPIELSRHVSVHQADAGHYTEGNFLIALMLVASVLRGIQDGLERVRAKKQSTS